MQILTVDVGTGTQDVLLFDSERELENCPKLVMPSPTVVIADRIRAATRAGEPVLLEGVTMGGGPCHWAALDHVRAGHALYATPDAARTFDDDLEAVGRTGVRVVSDDEAKGLRDVVRIRLRDFWLDEILDTLARFGVDARLDAAAVAVFDHGAAPPGYSDRIFRFEYLAERVRATNDLASFAYRSDRIPPRLTRLQAVADSFPLSLPLLVMDTAPAAVLGALEDERVRGASPAVIANVGNFHCLAFRIEGGQIAGLFEHHTGELTAEKLERYLRKLIAGTLTNDEVYRDMGHGALLFDGAVRPRDPAEVFIAATGPRRALIRQTSLPVYLAVPHGDMMLAGNFGLLRAFAHHDERVRAAVARALRIED